VLLVIAKKGLGFDDYRKDGAKTKRVAKIKKKKKTQNKIQLTLNSPKSERRNSEKRGRIIEEKRRWGVS